MNIFNYLISFILIFIFSFFVSFLFDKNFNNKKILSDKINNKKIEEVVKSVEQIEIKTPTELINKENSNSTVAQVIENKSKNVMATNSKENCSNENEILLLDITINKMETSEPVRVERNKNGNFILPKNLFEDLNIIPKNSLVKTSDCLDGYLLDSSYKFKTLFDNEKFSLDIEAPVEAFALNIYNKKKLFTQMPDESKPGSYLNYQVYGTKTEDSSSNSGFFELVGFGKFGSLSNGIAARDIGKNSSITRADTYLRKDYPGTLETLTLGDTVSNDGDWSRAVRFAGFKWATNHKLQPGYVYTPNPIIKGSAAVPSVVDIYINNQKTFSQKVTPGPFDISNLPIPTGAGNIDLVVTDILGNQQIIKENFYNAQAILYAKGEKDYTLESGFFRKDYGLENLSYSKPFTAGTYLYGVTDTLTARTRVELEKERQAIGGDISSSIGNFAATNLSLATSNSSENGLDNRVGFNIESSRQSFSSRFNGKFFGKDFTQIADSGGSEKKIKSIKNIGLSMPLFAETSINADFLSSAYWNEDSINLLNLSSGIKLPFGGSLSVSGSRRFDTKNDWGIGVSVNYQFNEYNTRHSRSTDPSGISTNNTSISTSPPSGPGIGWSATNENFEENNRLNAVVNTNAAQWVLDLSQKNNSFAQRLGVSGSLGYMQNEIFKSRTIGDSSFAIAKVGDFEGIDVYGDNQLRAKTNKDGIAIIPIFPYSRSKIEIKEEDIPLELSSSITTFEVTSYARSGVFVEFPIKFSKNALVLLELLDGSPVPAGANISITNNPDKFMVAKNGEAYLTNLTEKTQIIISWLENKCELNLVINLKNRDEETLGPYKCLLK